MMTASRRVKRSTAAGDVVDDVVGYDDRTVAVAMDDVVGRDEHPEHADRAAELHEVHMGVKLGMIEPARTRNSAPSRRGRGPSRRRRRRRSQGRHGHGSALRPRTHRTRRPGPSMSCSTAIEGSGCSLGDVLVVAEADLGRALRSRGCGSRERMRAVRAKATTGFISGNAATTGRQVKPSIPPRRRDDLEIIADRRRVPTQAVRAWSWRGWEIGHRKILRQGGKEGAPLYRPRAPSKAFSAAPYLLHHSGPPVGEAPHDELHGQPF